MGLSPVEITVIVLVIVLLFGVKKLPELGSGLGQAISNFKKSYRDASSTDTTADTNSDKKTITSPPNGSDRDSSKG